MTKRKPSIDTHAERTHLALEQGSPEWIAARIGIPTASQFSRAITKTGALSASRGKYVCELLAEWILGAALDPYVSEWMERGLDLEESARAWYELQRGCTVEPGGFHVYDRGDGSLAGASPDGLIAKDGLLEIKSPSPGVHVSNLLNMDQHRTQVQGQLWVCGKERRWCDVVSYHPDMPSAIVRVPRDDDYIGKLELAVGALQDDLRAAAVKLVRDGYVDADKLKVA